MISLLLLGIDLSTVVPIPDTEATTNRPIDEISQCIDGKRSATTVARTGGLRMNIWVVGPLSRAYFYSVDIRDNGATRTVQLWDKEFRNRGKGDFRKLMRICAPA